MGFVAPKARHQADPDTHQDSDSTDPPFLDGHQILATLEAIPGQDHYGDPARGIAYGIVFGALSWAIAIAGWNLI